jgi:hypothetical protein
MLLGLRLDFFWPRVTESWKGYLGDRKGLTARLSICPPLPFRWSLFDCVGWVGIAVAVGSLLLGLVKLSLDQRVQAVLRAEVGDAGVGADASARDDNDLP